MDTFDLSSLKALSKVAQPGFQGVNLPILVPALWLGDIGLNLGLELVCTSVYLRDVVDFVEFIMFQVHIFAICRGTKI